MGGFVSQLRVAKGQIASYGPVFFFSHQNNCLGESQRHKEPFAAGEVFREKRLFRTQNTKAPSLFIAFNAATGDAVGLRKEPSISNGAEPEPSQDVGLRGEDKWRLLLFFF